MQCILVRAHLISHNACLSACEETGQWPQALHLLDTGHHWGWGTGIVRCRGGVTNIFLFHWNTVYVCIYIYILDIIYIEIYINIYIYYMYLLVYICKTCMCIFVLSIADKKISIISMIIPQINLHFKRLSPRKKQIASPESLVWSLLFGMVNPMQKSSRFQDIVVFRKYIWYEVCMCVCLYYIYIYTYISEKLYLGKTTYRYIYII